jgi:hypothetical protein
MIFAGLAVAVIGVGVAVNSWFGDRLDALPNELQHINGPLTFNFEWAPMKQGEMQIEQGALVLPVNIGGCSKFRMQLDTAAASSHLVQAKMDNLAGRHQSALRRAGHGGHPRKALRAEHGHQRGRVHHLRPGNPHP